MSILTQTVETDNPTPDSVLEVAREWPCLQGEAFERIEALQGMTTEEFIFMVADVNRAVQSLPEAQAAAEDMHIRTRHSIGARTEYRIVTSMPASENRLELFIYLKQLVNQVIADNADDPELAAQKVAWLVAQGVAAIHPFDDGNGRTGRSLFYLLNGQPEGLGRGLRENNRELHIMPYDPSEVASFVQATCEQLIEETPHQKLEQAKQFLDRHYHKRKDGEGIFLDLKSVDDVGLRNQLKAAIQQEQFGELLACVYAERYNKEFKLARVTSEEAAELLAIDRALKVEYATQVMERAAAG